MTISHHLHFGNWRYVYPMLLVLLLLCRTSEVMKGREGGVEQGNVRCIKTLSRVKSQ